MTQYALPSYVHCCWTKEGVIILDLRNNKYLGLGASQARGLEKIVSRWPQADIVADACLATVSEPSETAEDIAKTLYERGLLSTGYSEAPSRTLSVPTPAMPMISGYDLSGGVPSFPLRHTFVFASACLQAAAMLKLFSLERIVSRVTRRKQQTRTDCRRDLAATKLTDLATSFHDLRPFLFTGADHCLFDSLALVEFLARYGLYPTWVFGVRANPFGAHCWVQHGDLVLNSSLEQAREFSPILII